MRSLRMSAITTTQPAAPKASQIPKPMLCAPPVTIATWFRKLFIMAPLDESGASLPHSALLALIFRGLSPPTTLVRSQYRLSRQPVYHIGFGTFVY